MITLDSLDENYALKNKDPYFSSGLRSSYRFALPNLFLQMNKLNLNGPEPIEYLDFAKLDLQSADRRGSINAITNTKRAIHLTIQNIFEIFGLQNAYSKSNFPTKMDLVEELELLPMGIIGIINQERNKVEHEYKFVNNEEVSKFIDVAELFLLVSYPFLRNTVIGAMVGIENDDKCYEYKIFFENSIIQISSIEHDKYIDSEIGKIYYNFENDHEKKLINEINIATNNKNEWAKILNLFIYLTKRKTLGLYLTKDVSRYVISATRETYNF